MNIGCVPSPREWVRWPEAEALLEPARKLADNMDTVLDDGELLWAVMDGDDLVAAATTRMTTDNHWEVLLVGGRYYRRWIEQLDAMFGAVAAEAGATRLMAFGRAGWRKALSALGWGSVKQDDGFLVYYKHLAS